MSSKRDLDSDYDDDDDEDPTGLPEGEVILRVERETADAEKLSRRDIKRAQKAWIEGLWEKHGELPENMWEGFNKVLAELSDEESGDKDDHKSDEDSEEEDKDDAIIEAMGVKALREYGYIDYIHGEEPPRPDADFFQSDMGYVPESMKAKDGNSGGLVHPILKRTNWPSEPEFDDIYELLLPALRLTSALLCEPGLQRYLEAIYRQDRWIKIPGLGNHSFQEHPTGPEDSADNGTIWRKVASLQSHIRFTFMDAEDSSGGTVASTSPDAAKYYQGWNEDDVHGFVKGKTMPALIEINLGFKQFLMGTHPTENWTPLKDFDALARERRVHFHLGVNMFHEIAHALCLVSREYEPSIRALWHKPATDAFEEPYEVGEPFYRDHRLAELGWATEQLLFNSMHNIIVHRSIRNASLGASCVYGVLTERFPGVLRSMHMLFPHLESRGSAAHYGLTRGTRYPVPMDYIHRFFTTKFWQDTVPKYGLFAYHAPKWHGASWSVKLRDGETMMPTSEREVNAPSPVYEADEGPAPPIHRFDPTKPYEKPDVEVRKAKTS